MNIRSKLFIALLIPTVVLFVTLMIISKKILLVGFEHLEAREAKANIERARNAIAQELDTMLTKAIVKASDLEICTKSSACLHDENNQFLAFLENKDKLKIESVFWFGADYAIKFDSSAIQNDKENKKFTDFLKKLFIKDHFFNEFENNIDAKKGYIVSPEHIILVVSVPIIERYTKEKNGSLVLTKVMDSELLMRLNSITKLNIELKSIDQVGVDDTGWNEIFNLSEKIIENGNDAMSLVKPINDQKLSGYGLLSDYQGDPAIAIKVEFDRDIYLQGQKTIELIFWAIAIFSLALSAGFFLLLERMIFKRIMSLSSAVKDIERGEKDARADTSHNDEISYLASSINSMVSQNQLFVSTIEEKNKNVENLVRILCHDISGSLTMVYRTLDYAQLKLTEEQIKLIYLQKGLKAAKWINQIIKNVRILQQVTADKMPLELENVSPIKIVEEIKNLFDEALKNKNLELVVRNELPESQQVLGNHGLLVAQVFSNIMSNAIKFSPLDAKIELDIFAINEYICFKIRDYGNGIPEKILDRLFDHNGETTRVGTSGEKGTGFGMPIVKAIIEKLKGKIIVQSQTQEQTLDHGTEITIFLLKSESNIKDHSIL